MRTPVMMSMFALSAMMLLPVYGASVSVAEEESGFNLSFSEITARTRVVMAYGYLDGGNKPKGWDCLAQVSVVEPGAASMEVPFPEGWGRSVRFARFFLAEGSLLDYDSLVDSLTATEDGGYVNTGVFLRGTNWVEMTFTVPNNIPSSLWCFWCARYGTGSGSTWKTFTSFRLADGTFRFDMDSQAGNPMSRNLTPGTKMIMVGKPKDGLYIGPVGGVSGRYSTPKDTVSDDFVSGGPLVLLSYYNGYNIGFSSATFGGHLPCACHSVRILADDGNLVVHEYIPAVKDGVYGFYDTAEDHFVGGSSVDKLAVGGVIVKELPVPNFAPLAVSAAVSAGPVVVAELSQDGSGFDLEFSGLTNKASVIFAYGSVEGGDTADSWEHAAQYATVSAETRSLKIPALPGWGDSIRFARFFIADGNVLDYDILADSLTSTADGGYVNTGVFLGGTNWVEMAITVPDSFGSALSAFWCARFGSSAGSTWKTFTCFRLADGKLRLDVGAKAGTGVGHTFTAGAKAVLVGKPQEGLFVGENGGEPVRVAQPSDDVGDNFVSGGPLVLLSYYNGYNNGFASATFAGHLPCACHSVRILADGGRIVARNYIPAVKDGVPGFYDAISGTFAAGSDREKLAVGTQVFLPLALPSFPVMHASAVLRPRRGFTVICR